MDSSDVLIAGGGPAGSSCAWRLRQAGLDVAILDKARFPRDKICGGWITPPVLAALEIDPGEYARGRVLQPITGFRTSILGSPVVETLHGRTVSYGIRRCEFDHYLLARSGARVFENVAVHSIERSRNQWVVNGSFLAPVLVGAGGHFCPVARHLGATGGGPGTVAAQEAEWEIAVDEASACPIDGRLPEIFFSPDLRGYGWCFRKGNYLNVGLGRVDTNRLPDSVAEFVRYLLSRQKLKPVPAPVFHGHAYLLGRGSQRKLASDGVLLIGDAAGLAYPQSGEGILPAVESGLMAAEAIRGSKFHLYESAVNSKFRQFNPNWAERIGSRLPARLLSAIASPMFRNPWFVRSVVIDRWFLHAGDSSSA